MALRQEPPYEGIADAMLEGEVIPFLGSAASLPDDGDAAWHDGSTDRFPTAKQLALHLAKKGDYPRDPARPSETATVGELPDASQPPSKTGSEELPEDPWVPELRKAAQYITLRLGRQRLVRYLDEIFKAEPPLGRLHRYLARVASSDGDPLIVVTTNYDDLLERAFVEAGKDFLLIVHTTGRDRGERLLVREPGSEFEEKEASSITSASGVHAVIYKMHGSVQREDGQAGQYVITDDDYVDFLARMTRWAVVPAVIYEPLKFRSFLFLGYGLEDWNLRVLLSQLAESQIQLTNWAIQKGPSLFDQSYWEKKGVDVYDMTIQRFISALERYEASGNPDGI